MDKALEFEFDKLSMTYESLYEDTIDAVVIDGKKIKDALKEQLHLQVQWEMFVSKISSLKHRVEVEKEKVFANAIGVYVNHSHRSYTITEAKELAKSDKDYLEVRVFAIGVYQIHDEAKGILDTIQSRKYILNNMSNLFIATSENIII